ncbi:hypothetical protein [Geodermatophilus ruber]|uniref:Uncharacterized protein n=1 Tax=Geodermatophilus ruber TaxID=504800 RepID=A0A1I4H902_9ACTN|nr:hypothetical protein [Geodermatophilus ruber]SFL38645.1 hypothetical protein SAMN04488085_11089 [Geodermatophilus ruber]
MTEGNMTGRPHGGVNKPPDDDVLPGEKPAPGEVGPPPPQQEPRAAREGEMSRHPGEPGSGVPNPDDPPVGDDRS